MVLLDIFIQTILYPTCMLLLVDSFSYICELDISFFGVFILHIMQLILWIRKTYKYGL